MFKIKNNNTPGNALVGAAIFVSSLLLSTSALAYQNRDHERVADQAYQILNLMRRGQFLPAKVTQELSAQHPGTSYPPPIPLTSRPDGVTDEARWQKFVQEALAAPDKLNGLLLDLPDPKHPSADCLNSFPNLGGSGGAGGAGGTGGTGGTGVLAKCRAKDLTFAPARGWGTDSNRCYLRRGYLFGDADEPQFFQSVPSNYTGALLSYWAENVDDEVEDTHVTWRPTNVAFVGAVKSISKTIVDDGLAIVFAPFYCFVDFFLGGNCIDDAIRAGHDTDPIHFIDDVLDINIGDWKGNDLGFASLVGLWHFIRPLDSGSFNEIPGLKISEASVFRQYDSTDVGALALIDLSGLSLNPDASLGVRRYAPYADGVMDRLYADWVGTSFAHVEFEPLDNVGRYGWDSSPNHHRGSRLLGWPIHAVFDALVPHHVAGVLGWGHTDWEQFAANQWTTIFNEKLGSYLHYYDFEKILAQAYRYWVYLDDQWNRTKKLAVSDYVTMIATETITEPECHIGGAFRGTCCTDDLNYTNEVPFLTTLLTRGMGAVLALMVKAANEVPPYVGDTPADPCDCAEGTARLGMDANGKLIHTGDGNCTPCGSGAFSDLPLWLDSECVAACPGDKPLSQPIPGASGSKCVATCTSGTCTGVACPSSDAPFVDNGACVARCSNKVAYNRLCQDSCPTGQVADSAGFCVAASGGPSHCYQVAFDSLVDCCRVDGCACVDPNDCDSGTCNPDGKCVSSAGKDCSDDSTCGAFGSCQCSGGEYGSCACCHLPGGECSIDMDCCENRCLNGACVPWRALGQPCGGNSDCQSGVCGGDGVCWGCGVGGCQCLKDQECSSGVCSYDYSDPEYEGPGTCLGLAGESCTSGYFCDTGSCQGGVCSKGAGGANCAANGDCVSGECLGAQPGQLGKCSSSIGEHCSTDSQCGSLGQCKDCSGTQCQCCRANTSSCSGDADCCEHHCVSGTCFPWRGVGQPCASWSDCQPNLWCEGSVCKVGDGGRCSAATDCRFGEYCSKTDSSPFATVCCRAEGASCSEVGDVCCYSSCTSGRCPIYSP